MPAQTQPLPKTPAPADSTAPASVNQAPWRNSAAWCLFAVLAATVLAYYPVLFDFFCGDDFVHLTWLSEAVKHPDLILRNFYSSWLDGTTTKFYRPLISIFMVTDYLVWGTNGLGFHITNLLFLLGATASLFGIVTEISKQFGLENGFCRWAVVSAALFGLYPLHPEAVSWITGRVDAIVTFFCLCSFYGYLRWRESKSVGWLLIGAFSMILGLLSKEMAITLPALFLCWEFFRPTSTPAEASGKQAYNDGKQGKPEVHKLALRIGRLLRPTLFFWFLLAAYFLVRRLALGTFVGGYDDSLLYVANLKAFLAGWAHALKMLLVPINKDLMGAHHILTRAWNVLLALDALLILWCLRVEPQLRRPFGFAVFWLALSLAPVYKLFSIADDLQGSRLAYLATAPLCVVLASAVASGAKRNSRPIFGVLRTATALVFAALCGIILWTNNQAWAMAGQESNAIRTQLERLYAGLTGDPQVVLIGLPDNIHGAYVCRNAVWGMVKRPQLSRDIQNCLMIDRFEPILPFGFLKQSLQESRGRVFVYRWESSGRKFVGLDLPSPGQVGSTEHWDGPGLQHITQPLPGTTANWNQDGSMTLSTQGPARPSVNLKIENHPCWDLDFLDAGITLISNGPNLEQGADLFYANDLHPDYDLRQRIHCSIKATGNRQKLIFALHGLPDWVLGGHCRGLKLLLPAGSRTSIDSTGLVPISEVIPVVKFDNCGFLGSKGFIHLSQTSASQEILVDARNIPGAAGFVFEITRPNLYFETQNSSGPDASVLKRIKQSFANGSLTLKREMFPSPGMYQARAWATDRDGKTLGLAGDHVIVSVDK